MLAGAGSCAQGSPEGAAGWVCAHARKGGRRSIRPGPVDLGVDVVARPVVVFRKGEVPLPADLEGFPRRCAARGDGLDLDEAPPWSRSWS